MYMVQLAVSRMLKLYSLKSETSVEFCMNTPPPDSWMVQQNHNFFCDLLVCNTARVYVDSWYMGVVCCLAHLSEDRGSRITWNLRFSRWYISGFGSSRLWHCASGWVVTVVPLKHQQHSVISQKIWTSSCKILVTNSDTTWCMFQKTTTWISTTMEI